MKSMDYIKSECVGILEHNIEACGIVENETEKILKRNRRKLCHHTPISEAKLWHLFGITHRFFIFFFALYKQTKSMRMVLCFRCTSIQLPRSNIM